MNTAETYNGWANYETWNVALWISNDYELYSAACNFMADYDGNDPYNDFVDEVIFNGASYCVAVGTGADKTPDGVEWEGSELDYDALKEFMREFAED